MTTIAVCVCVKFHMPFGRTLDDICFSLRTLAEKSVVNNLTLVGSLVMLDVLFGMK
jgi:hypothetical protein